MIKKEDFSGLAMCSETPLEIYTPDDRQTGLAKPSVLLHACCGPCSTACVERLLPDYDITVFYYNPCITNEEEYYRRRDALVSFINQFNEDPAYNGTVKYMEGVYDRDNYLMCVEGLEGCREGGARCTICFDLRLDVTAETAKMMNFDYFATTLTVSPHKDYDTISAIGKRIAMQYRVNYLDMNFKKKDGFKRSIELSKKYGLYRQNYCGCDFSKWEGCEEQ